MGTKHICYQVMQGVPVPVKQRGVWPPGQGFHPIRPATLLQRLATSSHATTPLSASASRVASVTKYYIPELTMASKKDVRRPDLGKSHGMPPLPRTDTGKPLELTASSPNSDPVPGAHRQERRTRRVLDHVADLAHGRYIHAQPLHRMVRCPTLL